MEPEYEAITDGATTWRFERSFFESRWTCIWGRGCLGIDAEPAPELGLGCCSVGAEMGDEDEAMMIAALAATLPEDLFQFAPEAAQDGVFSSDGRSNTRVVDGACIFLNRPGFEGGAGCALHLAALRAEESPTHWKPSVCWQLPVHVDWEDGPDGTETATVRRWSRADWGPEGETMAWCCTEGTRAYVGAQPVVESLSEEVQEMAGERVYLELRRRLQS
jgi:hypothetical protein